MHTALRDTILGIVRLVSKFGPEVQYLSTDMGVNHVANMHTESCMHPSCSAIMNNMHICTELLYVKLSTMMILLCLVLRTMWQY